MLTISRRETSFRPPIILTGFPTTDTTMERSIWCVLVIGGGLCGLNAAFSIALEGHNVLVFESAPQIHQVGAGTQIIPNCLRILRKWGVAEELTFQAATPETFSIFRYDGQRVLAHRSDYDEEITSRCGELIWRLHCIDLQEALARMPISTPLPQPKNPTLTLRALLDDWSSSRDEQIFPLEQISCLRPENMPILLSKLSKDFRFPSPKEPDSKQSLQAFHNGIVNVLNDARISCPIIEIVGDVIDHRRLERQKSHQ